MNGQNKNPSDGRSRFTTPNIDTVVRDIRFKEDYDGRPYRMIDSTIIDENEGIVQRVAVEVLLDACGQPIIGKDEVAGICSSCGRMVKKGNAVKCQGSCGGLYCRICYRRQGSHVLHGRMYCRHDYWRTKLFWQWISPSLRQNKSVERVSIMVRRYEEPARNF